MTTLTIYLRSGNQLRLPHIQDWKIRTTGGKITYLSITKGWLANLLPHPKLVVESIDLSQIEAITST
jgi:hypothetical protein